MKNFCQYCANGRIQHYCPRCNRGRRAMTARSLMLAELAKMGEGGNKVALEYASAIADEINEENEVES